MKLDKHSNVPLYCQLKDFILSRIDAGVYEKGSKIPSEIDFCTQLGLSRPTVRQAIAELVSEGKLQIVKGKGTFVSRIGSAIEIKGFNGMTFSFLNSKEIDREEIIQYEIIEALNEEQTKVFNDASLIRDGVYHICKALTESDVVYAYVESFIPVCIFPNLLIDIEAGKSLVDITVNKYAYLPSRSICSISVEAAPATASHELDVSRGTPVLITESILTSRSGAVCEIVKASLRSDICKLSV